MCENVRGAKAKRLGEFQLMVFSQGTFNWYATLSYSSFTV